MSLHQILLINVGALITALGGIFLKRLSASAHDLGSIDAAAVVKILANPNLWLGGICYVLPILLWAYLLRTMELTKLQPLLAVVYVYTVGLAYLFFGEQPSLQRILGIAVVVVGVVMVGRS